jgi:uncharacterized protein YeaC (DUF1315 family)
MDEREENTEKNDEKSHETDTKVVVEDMRIFLTVYNAFIQQVMELEWPDKVQLKEDTKLQQMLFQMFWAQRHRQRMRDARVERKRNHQTNDDEQEFNFRVGTKENFKRFLRHQMEANNNDDAFEKNTTFIDPGEATPDGEHSTDEAVGRRERFREEWE